MTYFIDIVDKRNQILKNLLTKNGYRVFEYNDQNLKTIEKRDVLVFAPNKKMQLEEALNLPNDIDVIMGNIGEEIKGCFEEKNINHINLLEDEIFAIKNAELTAEGILAIILKESERSMFESKILILGSGRVGKATAILFKKLGLTFSLVSYRNEVFAENYLFSDKNYFKETFKDEIKNFDIIINTIPAKVLGKEIVDSISKDTIFIEIASINTLNLDDVQNFYYILSPALPQKFSCESAGMLMYESIIGQNKF